MYGLDDLGRRILKEHFFFHAGGAGRNTLLKNEFTSLSSSSIRVFCVKLCPQEMAAILSHYHPRLFSTATRINSATRDSRRRGSGSNSVRCADVSTATNENRQVTVSYRSDSLEICRVLNGMWQTSGGWGRIDRDDAVEAMLRYADAGLSTFDMADHCTFTIFLLAATLC